MGLTAADPREIIYVGDLGHEGEVPDLLAAFALVAPHYPDVVLRVVGEAAPAQLDHIVARTTELGIAERVVFAGHVERARLPDLLCSATMHALLRRDALFSRAGFPTKLGEYLASGRPVVVTATGDIPRYLTHGVDAYMAPPGDPERFAAQMRYVLDHEAEASKVGPWPAHRSAVLRSPAARRASQRLHQGAVTSVCGIAGLINASADDPVSRHTLEAMTAALVHRGPDASGHRIGHGVGLGHRRLSIIDLSSGDQPMPNEDGTVWVTFNGEIFNYEELRRQLTAKGHVFATQSDTEVIVHQYEEDEAACVERFRGMFAFAIWDERRQQVLLARDRFGIKPLFVAEGGGQLAFASEMRALLASPSVDRSWSAPALRAYLWLGYVPGALTAYRGIRRFAPGTVETWRRDDGGAGWVTTAHRYWRPRAGDGSARLSYGEAKSQLRELLLKAFGCAFAATCLWVRS